MKALIFGAGRVGKKIVRALVMDGYFVTVVDNNEKSLSEIIISSKVKTIYGSGMNRELLTSLGVEKFDFIVATTDSDKTNILISTLTKKMGAKYIIARIEQTDSMEQLLYLKESLGIDYIVNPDFETTKEVERIFKSQISYQADTFAGGKIEVVGHRVEAGEDFAGHRLKDIGSLATILVVAIQRGPDLLIPNGEMKIEEDDYLYLMGLSKDIMNFKITHFQIKRKNTKKIVIVGGGQVAGQLAIAFRDHDITIIEKNSIQARYIRRNFPDVFVVNTDFYDDKFFEEADVESCDLFIALTDNDELNIVMGMMAKKLLIPQVMIKNNSMYTKILDNLDLTAILNPITISSNKMIKKLRSDRGASIYLTFNGDAEVMEAKISDDNEIIGKRLDQVKLPQGVVIGGIIRKDESIAVPRGKTLFKEKDTLVVFYKKESREALKEFINPDARLSFLDRLIYN